MLSCMMFVMTFSSCSSDDESSSSSSSSLVGTWVNTNDPNDVLTIGSNGSWYAVVNKNSKWEQIRKGTYTYMFIRNQPTGFYCRCDAQNPMYRRRKLS